MSEAAIDPEINKAYQNLGDEFSKVRSYEDMTKFYSSLGNFSMMLDPANKIHQDGYAFILNKIKQKFPPLFPEFEKQTHTCFSKLPEEQKVRYIQLSYGNAWQMMSPDDYKITHIKSMTKEATKFIAALPSDTPKPKEMLNDAQFLDVLNHFASNGTAEMTKFATRPESQAFADDFISGHTWIKENDTAYNMGLSDRLKRTKDIIAAQMHAAGLEAVLKTGDLEKISNYFLDAAAGRFPKTSALHDGEGVSAYKKEVSLMEQYLETAAKQPDIAAGLKLSQELGQMKSDSLKACAEKDSIGLAGGTLGRLLKTFNNVKSISSEELEKTLSAALNGKEVKEFSLSSATSSTEREKIASLNCQISLLKNNESLKKMLKPYDGALLKPESYADLAHKYQAANYDYQQKDTACTAFAQQHTEELKPAITYNLIAMETNRLKNVLDNETQIRNQARSSLGTDLDAKAQQMENMTPKQRYQSRVQTYYKAKRAAQK